jgi:hypothetical protein
VGRRTRSGSAMIPAARIEQLTEEHAARILAWRGVPAVAAETRARAIGTVAVETALRAGSAV